MGRKKDKKFVEALLRMSKPCRNCGHQRYSHALDAKCIDAATSHRLDEDIYMCSCYEFIPLDNLDYIEYQAEKRGL